MSTTHEVIDPWEGVAVGADFAWHKKNGYDGGTDNIVEADKPVYAASSGWATAMHDVTNGVLIGLPSGAHVGQLENKRLVGKFPRQVKLGEQIAVTGLVRPNSNGKPVLRWPHTDWRKADGTRDDIHKHVTLKKKQRRARVVTNVRPYPSTVHPAVGTLAAGEVVTAASWVTGEEVSGSTIWYKVPGGYVAAQLFSTVTKYGLSKGKAPIEPELEQPVEPPVVVEPEPPVVDPDPEPPVVVEPEPEIPPVVVEPSPADPTPPPAPKPLPAPAVGGLVAALLALLGLVAAALAGLFK